jgi:membrane protein YqaA with SNARE-associated domain
VIPTLAALLSGEELVLRLGLPLATFVYCVASGVIPIVNAEIFLVGVAAVAPSSSLWVVALVASLGQMVAKSIMYLGGRGVFRLPMGKRKADLEAVRAKVERWRSKDLLVFVSAALGLPPFFAIAILAGTLRFPFARFVLAGFAGRLVRFSLVLAVPQVGRWIVGGGPG